VRCINADFLRDTVNLNMSSSDAAQKPPAEEVPKPTSVAPLEPSKPPTTTTATTATTTTTTTTQTTVESISAKLNLLPDKLDWSTLPIFLARSMELAETYVGLTGAQKKAVVISAIQDLIKNLGKDTPLEFADPVFQALVPTIIDQLVTATKDGGLKINNPAEVVSSGAAKCCGWMFTK
jgi:hypothetical protein